MDSKTGIARSPRQVLNDVKNRATTALQVAERNNWLLDIALSRLTLDRVALHGAIFGSSLKMTILNNHRDATVNAFRKAGEQIFVAKCLLTSARLAAVLGQTAEARSDLDEAEQIAERGCMLLHLADVHLHRARLFFHEEPAAAREDLKQARSLIEKCGYFRRMSELEYAERVILAPN